MKSNVIILTFLLLTGFFVVAQQTINGVVSTQDTGEPVLGASVLIKNTLQGAQTDYDGNYALTGVQINDTLVFSFIGFKTIEIPFSGQKQINVALQEDVSRLKEVIVTGYEDISKTLFTGVSTKVDLQRERIEGISDASRMLEGKDAGVVVANVSGAFGASPQITIRGNTSINGNNNPLWVVDGVVLEDNVELDQGDLASGDVNSLIGSAVAGLNPDDVESFEILKDASGTALYGARAKNGVIIITTKKGSFGDLKSSYTSTLTGRIRPNYNQFDILNSQEEMSVYKEMVDKFLINTASPVIAPTYGVIGKMFTEINEKRIPWGSGNGINDNFLRRYQLANTDWFDVLFKSFSFQQQHTLSFSGGSEKTNYFFSLGYLSDPGQTIADQVERYNAKLSSTYRFNEKTSLNVKIEASIRDQRVAGSNNRSLNRITGEFSREFDINPYSFALNTSRSMTPYDENGNLEFFRRNFSPFNIIDELNKNYIDIDVSDISFQGDFTRRITSNLRISSTFNFRRAITQQEHIIKDTSNQAMAYRADDPEILLLNPFLFNDPDHPEELPYSVLPEGGLNIFEENQLNYFYIRNSLNWKPRLNQDNTLDILLGQEIRQSKRKNKRYDGFGISYDRGFITNVNPDIIRQQVLEGDQYFSLSNFNERFAGFFSKISFAHKENYFANATFRYDGSNLLGDSRDARYLTTWNISGGWNMHNSDFLHNHKWVNLLKLKLTYGLTGGRGPLTSATLNLQAEPPLRPYDRETLIFIQDLENEDLTFEKLREFSIGLEFGMIHSRISGELGYYRRNASDLIGVIRTHGVGGETFKWGNYAAMDINGFEFSMTTKNIKTPSFSWTTSLNIGYHTEKITDLRSEPNYFDALSKTGTPILGRSINSLYSVRFAGLNETGIPTFYIPDGEGNTRVVTEIDIQRNDHLEKVLKYEGTSTPSGVGGFFTTFKYKNFSFQANLSFKFDYKIRLDRNYQSVYNDFSSLPGELKNRWALPGDEEYTTIPSILDFDSLIEYNGNTYNLYNLSDLFIADGSYVRLRAVSLSYDVPKPIFSKLGLRSLQLKVLAENLALLFSDDKLKGQDPEFFNSGGVALPLSKVITFSLNTNF